MEMYEELISELRKGYTDRLNDAADAIENLQKELEKEKAFAECWEELAQDCKNRFRKLADAFPKWIPVTERLPEDGNNVIVCTKSENVGEAKYQAALGYDLDYPAIWFLLNDYGNQYQTEEIIAWMPLPHPPKEKT